MSVWRVVLSNADYPKAKSCPADQSVALSHWLSCIKCTSRVTLLAACKNYRLILVRTFSPLGTFTTLTISLFFRKFHSSSLFTTFSWCLSAKVVLTLRKELFLAMSDIDLDHVQWLWDEVPHYRFSREIIRSFLSEHWEGYNFIIEVKSSIPP